MTRPPYPSFHRQAMKTFPLLRAAAFGLAALPATAGAFELPRLCAKDKKEVERVTLPAREIEVVNEKPRVFVRETTTSRDTGTVRDVVSRDTVPVTTVYMPVSSTREIVTQPTREVVREVAVREDSGFEANYRAIVRGEMAKLEIQRTIEFQKKLLECLQSSGGSGGEDKSSLEKKLSQIQADLDKLNTRLTSVEKLLMYHDTLLIAEKGKDGSEVDGLKVRLENIEKQLLYLNKKVTEMPPK